MTTGSSRLEKSNNDPRIVHCIIGAVKYEALVDSGSVVNTVTSEVYNNIKESGWFAVQNVCLHPSEILKGYASSCPLEVRCSFNAFVKSSNSNSPAIYSKFFVVSGTKVSLLGFETASQLNLLKIYRDNEQVNAVSTLEKRPIRFPKIPMQGMKFRINKDITPKQIIRYNIPIAFEKEANERLQRMEHQGIIERADKDNDQITFVSPLVLVPKGCNDFRIVVDYREVNKAIIREPYPMPSLDRIWAEIPRSNNGELYFSKLDLSDAFFHVGLHESVRHYTTFMTANGLMRFKRLPFGLCCAPEIFQKVMEKVTVDCKGIIVYLDDILIFGSTMEELDKRTKFVKDVLLKNHLTINEAKSQYNQKQIDFVGLTIDGTGILPTKSKINDIMNFERPKNLSELRSFLGMMVFISPFIRDFSSRTSKLRELTRGNTNFKWEDKHEESFTDLKIAASKGLIKRGYFCQKDETILYTDASPWGIGAVLVQKDKTTKAERIIACASKSLTITESKYPQLHREALAIIWGMEKFTYYLLGRLFTLMSDSKALKFMIDRSNFKDCGKRIMSRAEGWFLRLEHFNFNFVHVSGENNIADAPSRLIKPGVEQNNYGYQKQPYELCIVNAYPQTIQDRLLILTVDQVKQHMKRDTDIQLVMEWLQKSGSWPKEISNYHRHQKEMYIEDGVLMKSEKMVLPFTLRYRALLLAHFCHPGMSTMKYLLRQGVWWPAMDRDVEDFVKSCPCCQLITEEIKPLPIVLTSLPNNAWEKVSLDFSTPSGTENWKALVIIDQYSRFLVAASMNKTDTESVKKVLKKIFRTYNLPKEVLLDNGPPFNSKELKSWIESYGIKYNNSTPLNPTENGVVERKMAGINKVAAIARLEKKSFDEALSEYVSAYNTWPHHSTKVPPAELMFGRAVRGFLPNLKTEIRQKDDIDFRKQDMISKMRRNQNEDRKRHAGERIIEVGDKVLMHQTKKDKADTTYKNCFFEVLDIVGGRVTIKDLNNGKIFERSVKHLKKFVEPSSTRLSKYSESSKSESQEKRKGIMKDNDSQDSEGNKSNERMKRSIISNSHSTEEPPVKRRSGRTIKTPKRFQDVLVTDVLN